MSEMQRLVGVGRREFDHDPAAGRRQAAEFRIGGDSGQLLLPVDAGERKVQETFHRIERRYLRAVLEQPPAYCVAGGVRSLTGDLQQREHDERIVTFEFLARGLHLKRRGVDVGAVDRLDGL